MFLTSTDHALHLIQTDLSQLLVQSVVESPELTDQDRRALKCTCQHFNLLIPNLFSIRSLDDTIASWMFQAYYQNTPTQLDIVLLPSNTRLSLSLYLSKPSTHPQQITCWKPIQAQNLSPDSQEDGPILVGHNFALVPHGLTPAASQPIAKYFFSLSSAIWCNQYTHMQHHSETIGTVSMVAGLLGAGYFLLTSNAFLAAPATFVASIFFGKFVPPYTATLLPPPPPLPPYPEDVFSALTDL